MVDVEITTALTEIEEYTKYVTSRLTHYSTAPEKKVAEHDEQIRSSMNNSVIVENRFVSAGRRLDSVEMTMTRMMDNTRALQTAFTTPRTAPPQMFDTST